MKKLFVIAMLAMVATTSVQAQFLRFGIKAGPNFSSFSGGVDNIDYKSRTSFHAGAVVQLKLLENFALQPEVLYSSQGADVDGVGDFNLDYISVPILAKFYILSDRLSLEAGPQFSFLVNDTKEVFHEVVNDDDAKSDTKSFDFAVAGGLELNITKNFFAQARYSIGLTDAAKDAEVKNAVFQVSVGYMF
jgi:opacity protein-like surface antigen